ncbi:hypothetical protein H0H93_005592, partial [Arthromyces matolae]
DKLQREEEKRMEAIHAALTDIMALEQEQVEKKSRLQAVGSKTASLRPPGPNKRRAMFDDDEDEEPDDLDANAAVDEDQERHKPPFQLAEPGDLQLSYEIARLGDNIANLESQDLTLDTLIKKA